VVLLSQRADVGVEMLFTPIVACTSALIEGQGREELRVDGGGPLAVPDACDELLAPPSDPLRFLPASLARQIGRDQAGRERTGDGEIRSGWASPPS